MQDFCISPRPSAAPWVKVSLQIVKEFEYQARQNICTLNFSAASNEVIEATAKRGKNQIQ